MFLPGFPFPPTLTATNDLTQAVRGMDLVVAVSPSHTVRQVMTRAREILPRVPILCASKGSDPALVPLSKSIDRRIRLAAEEWVSRPVGR
jgi:glycerol-3-phosphate dehydrogenase